MDQRTRLPAVAAATLNDPGDLAAEPGSRSWAIAVRREIQAAIHNRESDTTNLVSYMRLMEQHAGYAQLVDAQGQAFRSYRAFCEAKPPFGLGYDASSLDRIVAERKTAERIAASAEPLPKHGEVGNGRSRDSMSTSTGKRDAEYLTARIARDRPDILDRMKAGEFKSVRAAALEAGIVKRSFTIPSDVEAAAAALRRHFSRDDLDMLCQLIILEED